MYTTFKKHRPTPQPSSPSAQRFSGNSIPAFFIIRMLGWFMIATLSAIASIVLSFISKKIDASFVLGMILAALTLYKGLELLHISRKGEYFVLELECIEIAERSLKDVRNIWDPISQTAFRKTALITFVDAGGTPLQFIFDTGRRFVVGSSYKFYFRRPQNEGANITAEMLEQLKIDHEIIEVDVPGIPIAEPAHPTAVVEKRDNLDTNLYKTES